MVKSRSSDKLPYAERRRFIRHPVCFPLSYRVIGKAPKLAKPDRSMTVNMSIGGLLFESKRGTGMGSMILIAMPFQDKVFNVKAKVVHCNKSPNTGLYNIGVSFCRFSDAFKTKLIEQLYLISEFRDLRSMQLGRDITLEEASKEWIKRYSKRFRRLYW